MREALLVLNAGSSSIKFELFGNTPELPTLASGQVKGLNTAPEFIGKVNTNEYKQALGKTATAQDAVRFILSWVHSEFTGISITATGHRIVHGGEDFTAPVRVDDGIYKKLEALIPLAPLHQPYGLAGIAILQKAHPDMPQIACFDTAFHAMREELFTIFALPESIRAKGVRRYGFHGLSYEWIAHWLKGNRPELAKGRVVVAHLGSGASCCAMREGKSVDTTMGMSALDGLPMGTRSGALDPGALIYILRELGISPDDAEHMLYYDSGLKGIGGTGDMQELKRSNTPQAKLAREYFILKTAQFIAAMSVSIGGMDALIFTGGIGENDSEISDAVRARLSHLHHFETLAVPTDEERMMAIHMRNLSH